jgi:murein DD-endopeptidase MepM/ murein hydrolase activator NlpD
MREQGLEWLSNRLYAIGESIRPKNSKNKPKKRKRRSKRSKKGKKGGNDFYNLEKSPTLAFTRWAGRNIAKGTGELTDILKTPESRQYWTKAAPVIACFAVLMGSMFNPFRNESEQARVPYPGARPGIEQRLSYGKFYGYPEQGYPEDMELSEEGATSKILGRSVSRESDDIRCPIHGKGYITSRFGRRWGRRHNGVDLQTKRLSREPLFSPVNGGVVIKSNKRGWNGGKGLAIVIKGKDYIHELYHMSKVLVDSGDVVFQDDTLGYVGRSGRSQGRTGIHLHYGVRSIDSESWIDPLKLLSAEEVAELKKNVPKRGYRYANGRGGSLSRQELINQRNKRAEKLRQERQLRTSGRSSNGKFDFSKNGYFVDYLKRLNRETRSPISPYVMIAQIYRESKADSLAKRKNDPRETSYGLAQVQKPTFLDWKRKHPESDLTWPKVRDNWRDNLEFYALWTNDNYYRYGRSVNKTLARHVGSLKDGRISKNGGRYVAEVRAMARDYMAFERNSQANRRYAFGR